MVKEALTEEASTRETNSPFGLVIVLFLFALLAISAGLAGVIVVLSLVCNIACMIQLGQKDVCTGLALPQQI